MAAQDGLTPERWHWGECAFFMTFFRTSLAESINNALRAVG
jgi:hypothetical protein